MSGQRRAGRNQRKKQRRTWDDLANEQLRALYPAATWEDLKQAFPGHSENSLRSQAQKLGISRLSEAERAEAEKPKPIPDVPDAELAAFLSQGRSASEVEKKFGLPPGLGLKRIERGCEGFEFYAGRQNVRGETTYVAVPAMGSGDKTLRRAFTVMRQKDGQPYVVIGFPEDLNSQKLRIIPMDSILYGSSAHDADRFTADLRKVARNANTFCFLNGDIIAPVGKGKKAEKDQLMLARCAELAAKLRPIAHKILWAQRGCLETRSLRAQGFDPLEYLCEKFGIPYFKEPVYADLVWKGNLWTVWAMHGQGTAQVKGARINTLRRPAQMHDFTNFILRGHVRDAIFNSAPKIVRDTSRGQLVGKEEHQIVLPGYQLYFGTETSRLGHQPPSTETLGLFLYPNGHAHVKTLQGGMQ